jgi:hypothetical protein
MRHICKCAWHLNIPTRLQVRRGTHRHHPSSERPKHDKHSIRMPFTRPHLRRSYTLRLRGGTTQVNKQAFATGEVGSDMLVMRLDAW